MNDSVAEWSWDSVARNDEAGRRSTCC